MWSLNPEFPKNPKLVGATKWLGHFGFPCVFWMFSKDPKTHLEILGFSAEFTKNMESFDVQQKSKKQHMDIHNFSAPTSFGHFRCL